MTVTANGSATTVPTAPYSRAPTRACLVRAGVRFGGYYGRPFPLYPEIESWLAVPFGKYAVYVLFTKSDARATVLEQRYKQLGRALGATDAEIRRLIFRRRNVVYEPASAPRVFEPIPAEDLAALDRCLH